MSFNPIKYSYTMNNPSRNTSNSRIHYIYCIGILSAIIVLGITYVLGKDHQLTKDSDLVNYIAFASTISSLILSSFAIFYAISSNSSFVGTISELRNSSKDIALGAAEISSGSEKIKEVLKEGIDKLGERFEKHRTKTERALERISLGSQTNTEEPANTSPTPENSISFLKPF